MSDKILFIIGPFEEFHAFMKFNVFIGSIKHNYKKIYAIIPPKAIGIVSEASSIITVSNEYLNQRNANYPHVLDIMSNRNISDFHSKAIEYIKSNFEKYEILIYDIFAIKDEHGNIHYPEFSTNDLGTTYKRDFGMIKDWISKGNLLYPTKKSYDAIKEKYEKLIDDETYLILTRHFINKQPDTNTMAMFPNAEKMVKFLTENGIKIVNIGFPPAPFNIKNNNYQEIFDINLSHDDMMSLFYLSKAVFLQAENGGFSVHSSCNNNLFSLSDEWSINNKSVNISLIEARMMNPNICTIDFKNELQIGDFQYILNVISSGVNNIERKFTNLQEIIYIN